MTTTKKKNNKKKKIRADIEYGNVELDPLEFDPKRVKVRITTMIDQDILESLKNIASDHNEKYQSLLNKILRSYVESRDDSNVSVLSISKVREIVREEMRKKA